MSNFNDQGWHLMGKIFNIGKLGALSDEKFAFAMLEEIVRDLEISGDNVLQFRKTQHGITATVTNEDGSLSLHTFIDNKSAFVDFLCFNKKSVDDLVRVFKKLCKNYEAKNNSYTLIFRT